MHPALLQVGYFIQEQQPRSQTCKPKPENALYQSLDRSPWGQDLSLSAPSVGAPSGTRPRGQDSPNQPLLARNVPVVAQMFQSSGLCSPGTDGRHGVQRDGSSRGIGGVFWRGREIASFGISFQPLASLPRPPRVLSAPLSLSGRCLCRDPLRECEEPVLQEHASACQERGAKHASRPPFSQDLQSRWLDAEFPRLCNNAGRVWSWCVERGGDGDWC